MDEWGSYRKRMIYIYIGVQRTRGGKVLSSSTTAPGQAIMSSGKCSCGTQKSALKKLHSQTEVDDTTVINQLAEKLFEKRCVSRCFCRSIHGT